MSVFKFVGCGTLVVGLLVVLSQIRPNSEIATNVHAENNGSEREVAFQMVESDFDRLKNERGNLIPTAKTGESLPCSTYEQYAQYREIQTRYGLIGLHRYEFRIRLQEEMAETIRVAANGTYEVLQRGRRLGCMNVDADSEIIENIFGAKDDDGRTLFRVRYDPSVVRNGMLAAFNGEIADLRRECRAYATAECRGTLSTKVRHAELDWHFTPKELGVPDKLQRELFPD